MISSSPTYRSTVRSLAEEIPVSDCSVLITGASGMIGSCLADVFAEADRAFDKKITVYAMGRDHEKLRRRLGESARFRLIAQDVSEPITLPGVDYIIHAASNADPRNYALYPVETILTNIMGAKSVLECAGRNNARVMLTSSFEVYGKLDRDEYSETDYGSVDLDLIRSCYPESKRAAEQLFTAYRHEYGVDCVTARLSSVYGPTMQTDDSKAHAQFLRNALAGEDIVLKSKGTQKRTYCYVADAVSALLAVLFKGRSGEAYNVANDRSAATIAEVAGTIAELAGTKVRYDLPDEVESLGFSKPQNCVLRTDKLKSLGWQGRYDLRRGLDETLRILRGE